MQSWHSKEDNYKNCLSSWNQLIKELVDETPVIFLKSNIRHILFIFKLELVGENQMYYYFKM